MISLIVAMAENRVIGRENKLPWHLPEDLKRFRQLTTGHPIVMGRKTYESIGRLLPGRENIIVSRQAGYAVAGATVVGSLEAALERGARASGGDEVFVIGGGEIYRQALGLADRLYLTLVRSAVEGDAWFPELPAGAFRESVREDHDGALPYSFLTLDRL